MDKDRFYAWVVECCKLLDWPLQDGAKMMPDEDPSWFFAFDDGLTPEEATSEYREKTGKNH